MELLHHARQCEAHVAYWSSWLVMRCVRSVVHVFHCHVTEQQLPFIASLIEFIANNLLSTKDIFDLVSNLTLGSTLLCTCFPAIYKYTAQDQVTTTKMYIFMPRVQVVNSQVLQNL